MELPATKPVLDGRRWTSSRLRNLEGAGQASPTWTRCSDSGINYAPDTGLIRVEVPTRADRIGRCQPPHLLRIQDSV